MTPIRRLTALLCLLLLAGCASQQQARLPERLEPQLNGDHALMADGYRLPLQAWYPETGEPRAVVLALHGFNDYRQAFAGVGPFLAGHGIVTYAYDQRGFGETAQRGLWPGHRRLAADVRALSELIRARHPELPLLLLGESMGAAVAIAALTAAEPAGADGVVLMAPALWGRDSMPWYQRAALAIAVRLFPGWTPTGESLELWPSDNIEMLRALARDPLVLKQSRIDTVYGLVDLMDIAQARAPRLALPSLLLYGERDQIIPPEPVCRVVGRLPEPAPHWRLALYPDGWHMLARDLQAERVLADIAAWALDRAAPLPSGQEADPADWRRRICP